MAEKKQPDWERIEADYRAGVMSLREIADGSGVSHVTIAKRAKRDGWEKDLSAKIKAKADTLVNRSRLTEPVNTLTPDQELAVIDANAQAIATVKLAHRADIRRYRSLVNSLLTELESQTDDLGLYEQLGELMQSDDADAHDRLAELYRKVIGLPQRTKVMIDLANALKVLITLERESYGIAEAQKLELTGKGGGPVKSTVELTGDALLAELQRRGLPTNIFEE